jgi:serine protease Do
MIAEKEVQFMSVQVPRRPWSRRPIVATFAVIACLAVGAGWWATSAAADGVQPTRAETSAMALAPATHTPVTSYADAVERVAPAVVTVRVEKKAQQTALPDDPFFRQFFGRVTPEQTPKERGLGSGVIVSADGHILTNAHVVDGADSVRVALNDGREFTARVIGVDKASDLAVVDIKASGLPTLQLADSDSPRVGDVVLAVGNPLGIGETVTMGILSAKGRSTGAGDGGYEDFLQTDAPINHGNSGGALVTASGELIGITSQIVSPSGGNIGIGFAIPSNMARNVMDQLVATGHVRRAMIGVTIQPVTADIARSLHLPDVHGALVNSVEPDGPGAHAGLATGDVITAVNGEQVKDYNDLRNHISSMTPGATARLAVVRNGEAKSFDVKLGELETHMAASDSGRPGGSDALGVTVEPLTPRLADRLEVPRSTEGLAVTDVDPNGEAADAGIRPGDVIRQVDGKGVRSADALRAALKADTDRPALLLVQRGQQSVFVTIDRAQG